MVEPPLIVVHVIGSLNQGGAEKVALDLCRVYSASRVKQVFYCLSGEEGVLADEFRETGAIVIVAPPGGMATRLRGLREIARIERPDAIVSHVSLASAFVLAAIAGLGIPVRVARGHSAADGRGASRAAYRSMARVLLAFTATHVLAVSDSSQTFLVGRTVWLHNLRRVQRRVLVNGVDTAVFSPDVTVGTEEEGRTVLRVVHVGRAAPEKNRQFLVPLYHALTAIRPTEMWIIGSGGTADLGELPADKSFSVLGPRNDIANLLRQVDVLVLPSVVEGLPGVVLEALASGTPVVASDLETMADLARLPGVNLVALEDGHECWARQVATAGGLNVHERRHIAQALRASQFTLERSADDWLDIWRP